MSEEIKEELKECKTKKCECDGKCLKVFLLGILASFFGCLLALLLFSATVKPKMPPAPMMFGQPQAQQFLHGKFKHHKFKGQKHNFHQKFRDEKFRKNFDKDMSSENQKPDFNED